jgi:hypothetical protein
MDYVSPSKARFYWSATIGRDIFGGTETDQIDGYSLSPVDREQIATEVPEGWYILETECEHMLNATMYAGDMYGSALATLLWSEVDENDEPFDELWAPDDINESDRMTLLSDIRDFLSDDVLYMLAEDGISPEQAGHDFILSANGHGTGFWDRDGANCSALHNIARMYGFELYKGDDDVLYIA